MNEAETATSKHRREIEDNYLDYPEDEYGYTYDVWDVVAVADADRHFEIRDFSEDELGALDYEELDHFQLWAAARAHLANGNQEDFVDLAGQLLGDTDERHPVLVYHEVAVHAARVLAETDPDAALEWLGRWDEARDELMEARILEAVLASKLEDAEAAFETVLDEFPDEPELLYEIAAEWERQGHPDQARH